MAGFSNSLDDLDLSLFLSLVWQRSGMFRSNSKVHTCFTYPPTTGLKSARLLHPVAIISSPAAFNIT